MICPTRLKSGDRVGLVAPASPVGSDGDIRFAISAMASLELDAVIGASVRFSTGYLAGDDGARAEDLNRFLADPSIRAIFGLRGGFGSLRILDLIDYATFASDPKIVMGFSDLTCIISALTAMTGIITFHGPTIVPTYFTEPMVRAFRDIFMKRCSPVTFDWGDAETIIPGATEGTLYGGNLMSLSSLVGTRYLPAPEQGILFLEDLYEMPRKLDRALTQMRHAGVLARCTGVLGGNFIHCSAPEGERDMPWAETLKQNVFALNVPSVFGIDVGHDGTRNRYILPIGAPAKLDACARKLEILEHVVS